MIKKNEEDKKVQIKPGKIEELYLQLKKDTEEAGYNLNPDTDFTKKLVKGLLINQKRYGYQSCPCRLSIGSREEDLDIICPCDYRDPDLDEYGTCYCALYVTKEVIDGRKKIKSIPERRFAGPVKSDIAKENKETRTDNLKYPVWRCKVCGYLCARKNPPEVCPVCKVDKDRFEIFISGK